MQGPARLHAWIVRSRLSQREAAKLLGIHFTFLNQLLRERRTPSLANAVKIQQVTGVPVGAWVPTQGGRTADEVSGAGAKRKLA